jgi:hypothetical protein
LAAQGSGMIAQSLQCPECGGDQVEITSEYFDFGRSPETGYHDAGFRDAWFCFECRATGDDIAGDCVVMEVAA